MVGRCPEAVIYLGVVPVRCLLDTGSEVSMVTESFYREHLAPRGMGVSEASWLRITAANGLELPYLGYLEVTVTALGVQLPDMGILVVRDSPDPYLRERKGHVPGLLGCNVLRRLYEQTGNGRDMTATGNQEWIPVLESLSSQQPSTTQQVVADCHGDPLQRLGLARVGGRKPVLVPAQAVSTLHCAGRTLPGETLVAVYQGTEDCSNLPRGVQILDTLTPLKDGRLAICIANTGVEDVWVQPRSVVGEMWQVEVVDGDLEQQCRVEVIGNEVKIGMPPVGVNSTLVDTESNPEDILASLDADLTDFTPAQRERLLGLLQKLAQVFSKGVDVLGY